MTVIFVLQLEKISFQKTVADRRFPRWEGANLLLPPANEVSGKVMFLHVSVILFTGEDSILRRVPSLAGDAILSRVVLSLAGGVMKGASMKGDATRGWVPSTSRQYASYWNAFLF